MSRNTKTVPALMFHSVGLHEHPWAWSYISESPHAFEEKMARLAAAGFHAVLWRDLYEYMAGRKSLPANSILLTFDDGYLDNWVYIYPILKKYGMRGTIFVSPDFVDPGEAVRPNVDDVSSGRCAPEDLQVPGFLNWAEMRAMESSGVMDIQSHAMTHTWYFTSSSIVDFHRPQPVTPHPWLLWNARPERKPWYLNEDQQEFLPWGYPIFENRKSLAATRFFPDQGSLDEICRFVSDHGGKEFFEAANWRNLIVRRIKDLFGPEGVAGRFESESEKQLRINSELTQSKALIEKNLSKSVDFICWPGGANDESVQVAAQEAGYKSWTLDSRSQLDKRNLPGFDPSSIKRIGSSSQVDVRGRMCGTASARYFLWRIQEHQGSARAAILVKSYKAIKLAQNLLGPRI